MATKRVRFTFPSILFILFATLFAAVWGGAFGVHIFDILTK